MAIWFHRPSPPWMDTGTKTLAQSEEDTSTQGTKTRLATSCYHGNENQGSFPPDTSPLPIHSWGPAVFIISESFFNVSSVQSQLLSDVWRAEKYHLTCFHLIMSSRFTVTLFSLGFQSDIGNTARVIGGIKELLPVGGVVRQVTNQAESTLFITTRKLENVLRKPNFFSGRGLLFFHNYNMVCSQRSSHCEGN